MALVQGAGMIPIKNVRAALSRPLSARQLEIVRLLSIGHTNRQIARALKPRCTVAAVRYHINEAATLVPGDGHPTARLIYWYRGASRELLAGI